MTCLLRHIPACPPEFADEFVRGGWRRVELLYGARTDLLLKWIEMCGGEELQQRRREHMRENGIRPYGRAGGNVRKLRGVTVSGWLD